ncbi:MAG: hypothetical protein KBC43_12085 [Bacteroidales bacterium]|nr:hypothetical protein [Bacteroidales bacterium]
MKIILSIYLSLILLASWVSEANGQNNHSVEFEKVFNKDEIITINRIIEFYEIRDSINYVWKREHKTIHSPYYLSLKYPGKYVEFLEILSNQNDFMKEYYENIVQNNDIGPSNFARVMELYRDLDLNKVNYRFVEIIHLLMIDGMVLK